MALSPPVRNNKIVKVIGGAYLKNSELLLQLKKPVQLNLAFLKYTINIGIVGLTDLFNLSQVKDGEGLFEIFIVIHRNGTCDCYPGIILKGLVASGCCQSVNARVSDTVDDTETEDKLIALSLWVIVDKACIADLLTYEIVRIEVDELHDFHVIFRGNLDGLTTLVLG